MKNEYKSGTEKLKSQGTCAAILIIVIKIIVTAICVNLRTRITWINFIHKHISMLGFTFVATTICKGS